MNNEKNKVFLDYNDSEIEKILKKPTIVKEILSAEKLEIMKVFLEKMIGNLDFLRLYTILKVKLAFFLYFYSCIFSEKARV